MKSAKFTAAQDKESKTDFVDSVGAMVAYCEEHGGQIPRFNIEADYDTIDTIIKDLKEYSRSLIYEDKALAQEIENYIKNKEIADQMKKEREEARLKGIDNIELEDEDYQEFTEEIERQKEIDAENTDEEGEDE
jgi:hypothetical protein